MEHVTHLMPGNNICYLDSIFDEVGQSWLSFIWSCSEQIFILATTCFNIKTFNLEVPLRVSSYLLFSGLSSQVLEYPSLASVNNTQIIPPDCVCLNSQSELFFSISEKHQNNTNNVVLNYSRVLASFCLVGGKNQLRFFG